jgi:hypothetical protein
MTTDPSTSDAAHADQAARRDITYQEAFRKAANRFPSLLSDQAAAHQATLAVLMEQAHDEYDGRIWDAMPTCDFTLCLPQGHADGEPWSQQQKGHADDCPRGRAIREWHSQVARNRELAPTL